MLPRETIEAFDAHLESCGLSFEAVVVGGSALALIGVTNRQTRDFDILAPILPAQVAEAARAFATAQRVLGVDLADDWFNNGPVQLGEVLPAGWSDRIQPAFAGRAVVLHALGRADLLKSKLFALCDRGTDLADCIALMPSREELQEASGWLVLQDAHPKWPDHVAASLLDLGRRLGHGD